MSGSMTPLPPVSRATLVVAELIAVIVAVAISISMQLSLPGRFLALVVAQLAVGLLGYFVRLLWYRVWHV